MALIPFRANSPLGRLLRAHASGSPPTRQKDFHLLSASFLPFALRYRRNRYPPLVSVLLLWLRAVPAARSSESRSPSSNPASMFEDIVMEPGGLEGEEVDPAKWFEMLRLAGVFSAGMSSFSSRKLSKRATTGGRITLQSPHSIQQTTLSLVRGSTFPAHAFCESRPLDPLTLAGIKTLEAYRESPTFTKTSPSTHQRPLQPSGRNL